MLLSSPAGGPLGCFHRLAAVTAKKAAHSLCVGPCSLSFEEHTRERHMVSLCLAA